MKTQPPIRFGLRQRGANTAEFAVVSIFFLALVMAVIEFAHLMFVYSTAVEATRLGARMAVVCGTGDVAKVKARMKDMLPILQPANIAISYPGSSCSAADCDPVTVRIQGLSVDLAIPLLPLTFAVPDFATSLPAESLSSTDNPLCT